MATTNTLEYGKSAKGRERMEVDGQENDQVQDESEVDELEQREEDEVEDVDPKEEEMDQIMDASPVKPKLPPTLASCPPLPPSSTDVKPVLNPFPGATSPDLKPNIKDEDVKPVIPSSSSPLKSQTGGKRSPEEIAALRFAAQQRLAEKKAAEKALASKLKKEETQRRFLAAQKTLTNYGIQPIKRESLTVFGTGEGGADGTDPGPKEWEPSEKCSEEQLSVLKAVEMGENVCYTGSAGVGKSFLLKEITRLLEHRRRRFHVTATTGIAALQVNGSTIHSWAGIGLGRESLWTLYDRINKSKDKKNKWLDTQVLFIDEISMMDPELFTKLNLLGKLLRESTRPFGGIQIVLTGDFFQLPPVPNKDPKCMTCGQEHLVKISPTDSTLSYLETPATLEPFDILKCQTHVRGGERKEGCGSEIRRYRFAFQTESWAECRFHIMELTKVFRQDEPKFVDMLEKFRRGICDAECEETLKQCGAELQKEVKILPTNLFPHRADVDQLNTQEFNKLKDDIHVFSARDSAEGRYAEDQMERRLKDTPASRSLRLRVGCQVILLANLNLEAGFVNGSRGIIVDWVPPGAVSEDEDGKKQQIPKKQGTKGYGMGSEDWRDKETMEWIDMQREQLVPVVYFSGGRSVAVMPHSWVHSIDRDNNIARTQLPLALAWALTIHKSQGQSLDAVSVKLTKTFEAGQAYVALSRCRTLKGMCVEGFSAKTVRADPAVKLFYARIADGTATSSLPWVQLNPLAFFERFIPHPKRFVDRFGTPRAPWPKGTPAGVVAASLSEVVDDETVLQKGFVPLKNGPINAEPPRVTPPHPAPRYFIPPPQLPPVISVIPSITPSPLRRQPSNASQNWTILLKQAADAFVSHQSVNTREAKIGLFTSQARQLVAASLAAGVVSGVKQEDQMTVDTGYASTESFVSDTGGSVSGRGEGDDVVMGDEVGGEAGESSRRKKKRNRKKKKAEAFDGGVSAS